MDIIPQSCLREWPEFPVAVHTIPNGASVYIDDIWVGNTPFEDRQVDIGTRGEKQVNIRLKREGYKSINLWIKGNYNKETGLSTLKAGETYTWRDVHLDKDVRLDKNEISDGVFVFILFYFGSLISWSGLCVFHLHHIWDISFHWFKNVLIILIIPIVLGIIPYLLPDEIGRKIALGIPIGGVPLVLPSVF